MSEPKTELELQADIDASLETAADDAFGTDLEIAEQAAKAEETPAEVLEEAPKEADLAEEQTPEQIAKAKEDEVEAAEKLAKENEDKTPEEIEAKAAEVKAAEEKEALAKKDEDEDPYKTPEDLKGRTRERFEKLTGNLKTAHDEIQEKDKIITDFREVLTDTKMNPTELQNTLNLGKLLKEDPGKALTELNLLTSALSKHLGIIPPGVDALAGQEDLKQKVVDRELTIEDATEIAKYRTKTAADTKSAEMRTQQQREEQQQSEQKQDQEKSFVTKVEEGKAQVASFVESIKNEPDYEKIGPHLIESSKYAAENLAPELWIGYIKQEHTNIKRIAESMRPASTGTPLLNGGAPRAGQKEPQNMEQLADNML